MTLPASFKNLTKTDRRKQWQLVKTKHKAAITAAKLDFDKKLGPALDTYQTQVATLTKAAAGGKLTKKQVDPLLKVAWSLQKIVNSYDAKVKLLADPAKKELTAVLAAIEADIISWGKLSLAINAPAPSPAAATAQQDAARELVGPLDDVYSSAAALATRAERAQRVYASNQRAGAADVAGDVVTAARLVAPSARELAEVAKQAAEGKGYKLLKARAEATRELIVTFRAAVQAFVDAWQPNPVPNQTWDSDPDARSVEANSTQIFAYCATALTRIDQLP